MEGKREEEFGGRGGYGNGRKWIVGVEGNGLGSEIMI